LASTLRVLLRKASVLATTGFHSSRRAAKEALKDAPPSQLQNIVRHYRASRVDVLGLEGLKSEVDLALACSAIEVSRGACARESRAAASSYVFAVANSLTSPKNLSRAEHTQCALP